MQFIAVFAVVMIHVAASALWFAAGKDKLSMAAAVSVAFTLWLAGEVAERMTYRASRVKRSKVLVVLIMVVAMGGTATAVAAARAPRHPDLITNVYGTASTGFDIERWNGHNEYPLTNSEWKAECSEYSTRIDRVRCNTERKVTLKWMAEVKRAINYARADAKDGYVDGCVVNEDYASCSN